MKWVRCSLGARLMVETAMNIWKLSPVDLSHPNWEASTLKREITVRAENEIQAREIATMKTAIATSRTLGRELRFPPWKSHETAACFIDASEKYPSDGVPGILDPEGYDRE